MRAVLRRPLPLLATACLLTWVIGVSGTTGPAVNWTLFTVALGLLVVRGAT